MLSQSRTWAPGAAPHCQAGLHCGYPASQASPSQSKPAPGAKPTAHKQASGLSSNRPDRDGQPAALIARAAHTAAVTAKLFPPKMRQACPWYFQTTKCGAGVVGHNSPGLQKKTSMPHRQDRRLGIRVDRHHNVAVDEAGGCHGHLQGWTEFRRRAGCAQLVLCAGTRR